MVLKHRLDPHKLGQDADWEGNNVAFCCPVCGKVFIVSGRLHPKGRECPVCRKSIGRVKGGRKSRGEATLEWDSTTTLSRYSTSE
jgi:hypothetical protein